MIRLCLFLLVLLHLCFASKINTCTRVCDNFCPPDDASCKQVCRGACLETTKSSTAKFKLDYKFSLPEGENITGSDALRKYSHSTLFFTTLQGGVYTFNASSETLRKIYQIPQNILSNGEGKGLYDIAIARDFLSTRFVYLYYAAPCISTANHCNILSQYRYRNSELSYMQDVAVIPQPSSRRSGGWAKMDARSYNYATMKLSVGGNEDENSVVSETRPELSSIFSFIPSKQNVELESSYGYVWHNEAWATGVGNPISCTRSLLSQQRMYCISDRMNGKHEILKISGNRHYGNLTNCDDNTCSDDYKGGLPPLLTYEGSCAPSSIALYTGNSLSKKHRILVSQPSCYENAVLQRASVSELSFDLKRDAWKLIPLEIETTNLLFSEFTLVGADLHNKLYVAGYSLPENEYQVYEFSKK